MIKITQCECQTGQSHTQILYDRNVDCKNKRIKKKILKASKKNRKLRLAGDISPAVGKAR